MPLSPATPRGVDTRPKTCRDAARRAATPNACATPIRAATSTRCSAERRRHAQNVPLAKVTVRTYQAGRCRQRCRCRRRGSGRIGGRGAPRVGPPCVIRGRRQLQRGQRRCIHDLGVVAKLDEQRSSDGMRNRQRRSQKTVGTTTGCANCESPDTESMRNKLAPVSLHASSGVGGHLSSFNCGRRIRVASGCQSLATPLTLTRNFKGPNVDAPNAFEGLRVATAT